MMPAAVEIHQRAKRIAVIAAIAAAALVTAVIVRDSGADAPGSRFTFVTDEAINLKKGFEVRLAGRRVGDVTTAEPTSDGRARIGLRIKDETALPLRKGTRLRLRWAGTIRYTGRYVEVVPGPAGARPLREDEIAEAGDLSTVELDEVFGTFDRATRRALGRTLDRSGVALRAAAPSLSKALGGSAPDAVEAAQGVLEDLGADPVALDQLLRSADAVANAAAESRPGIRALLQDSATTLSAFGDEAASLQQTLSSAPAALTSIRRTLLRADRTLTSAGVLVERLAPGIAQSRSLPAPLTRALRTIVRVGPDARRTLTRARTAAPPLAGLLDRARGVTPELESVAKEATRQFRCVRPYAPEVGGFAGTWAGFWGIGDLKDKILRANIAVFPTIPVTTVPLTSPEYLKVAPDLRIAYPMPPGYVVGKPKFDPSCGVGPEVVTAAGDPEAVNLDPFSKKLVEFEPREPE